MISSLIDSASHIVLIAHKNPDADSLGSACAFYSYLLRERKKITLFCLSSELNPNLAFLPWYDKVTDRFPQEADLLISFDCGSYGRLGVESSIPLINIDHHLSNDLYGVENLVDTAAISTTEVVYDYFVTNGIKINGKMAFSLYAGLLDDSKCFRAPECSAKTFALAAALIDAGADHALCTHWLYQRQSLSSIRIRGALLSRMKLIGEGRAAICEVPQALLEATGASVFECKRVLDDALGMVNVQIALMVVEHPSGGVKISLRSDGNADCSMILAPFGGGGHRKRSGARLKHEAHHDVIEMIIGTILKELV
jgi:bifunctional oligoribonuclease and PAP phosphatase NrnA